MKLGDFFERGGSGCVITATRPVRFRAVKVDAAGVRRTATVQAEIACVTEAQRQEALRDAERVVAKLYGDTDAPTDRREDERKYHVLFRALRDKDDVRQPFADSVDELKDALVLAEASHVWREYLAFDEEEFPEVVDEETLNALVEEAKKKSLADLLSSSGYAVVRRCLPGLASRLTPR